MSVVALKVGFARGVSPDTWQARWKTFAPKSAIEFVAIDAVGLADELPLDSVDVMIERTAPGVTPIGFSSQPRIRHAIRLYAEGLALVVAKGHELANERIISAETARLCELIDHSVHHPGWGETTPWANPEFAPSTLSQALDYVAATGSGMLMPLPLAKHLASKRSHSIVAIDMNDPNVLDPTEIWASWSVDRDDELIQQFVGVLRGRTPRSSR